MAEGKARATRLEERVLNLNKIIDNMDLQIKEREAQTEALKEERQADQKQHEEAMAEKEKKLQEFFCTKLDRKLTKVADQHRKAMEEMMRSHEQQVILFE